MNEHVTDEVLLGEMWIADYQTRLGSSPFQMHTRMHTCGGTRSSLPLPMFLPQSTPHAPSSCLPLLWQQQSPCVLVPGHLLNTAAVEPERKNRQFRQVKGGLSGNCAWRFRWDIPLSQKNKMAEVWLGEMDSDCFLWGKSACNLNCSVSYVNVIISPYRPCRTVWCLRSFSHCCGRVIRFILPTASTA